MNRTVSYLHAGTINQRNRKQELFIWSLDVFVFFHIHFNDRVSLNGHFVFNIFLYFGMSSGQNVFFSPVFVLYCYSLVRLSWSYTNEENATLLILNPNLK